MGDQPITPSPKPSAIGSSSRSGVRCKRLYSIWIAEMGVQPLRSAVLAAVATRHAGEMGKAAVDDLASPHEIVQAARDFLHRGNEVIHVRKIEIDAIGLQPLEACFDRLHHVLPIVS